MGGQDYKSQQPRMRTMANERTRLSRRQKMVITQYHWAATVRYGWTPCFKKDRIPSFNRKSPHFKTSVTDLKLLKNLVQANQTRSIIETCPSAPVGRVSLRGHGQHLRRKKQGTSSHMHSCIYTCTNGLASRLRPAHQQWWEEGSTFQ